MRIIQWNLDTGLQGGDISGNIIVEDDASPEEIEAEVREDMWNRLSLTWCELSADGSDAEGGKGGDA